MTFHDGTPFDAKAVVWNFERWWKTTHPQHDNQVKAGQTFEYWEGQFGGFDDKSIVTKVEATGSHTCASRSRIRRRRSWPTWPCSPSTSRARSAVEKWGTEFGKHPVGTGAFKFVEWKPNQEVVLEANPDYWGMKPKVKRVVVRNIKDNSQRLGALKAGEIHGMEGLNPDDVAVVKTRPESSSLAAPDQHHRLHRLQLQGEGVPGQARAPGLRPRHQSRGDRRRALRRHRPGGHAVPAAAAVGLQQGPQGLRVQPGQGAGAAQGGRA